MKQGKETKGGIHMNTTNNEPYIGREIEESGWR
jgi:hypothetical protein